MSERRLRLILAGVAFAVLFLPVADTPSYTPYGLFALLWVPGILHLVLEFGIIDWMVPGGLAFFLSIPVLVLFNIDIVLMARGEVSWPKMLYRALILVQLPLIWHFALNASSMYFGVILWIIPGICTSAVLMEIVLMVSRWLQKSSNTG